MLWERTADQLPAVLQVVEVAPVQVWASSVEHVSKLPHKSTMPFQSGTAKIETRGWSLMGMNGGNLS